MRSKSESDARTRSEKSILNETLMAVSALPETLIYRQNTGQGWQGRPVHAAVGTYIRVEPRMKILAEARPINFGLPGAGDIAGVSRGRPVQVETKTLTGAQRVAQEVFERQWTRCGGLYILARSAEQAIKCLS